LFRHCQALSLYFVRPGDSKAQVGLAARTLLPLPQLAFESFWPTGQFFIIVDLTSL
jgi:hypothetical protein